LALYPRRESFSIFWTFNDVSIFKPKVEKSEAGEGGWGWAILCGLLANLQDAYPFMPLN
jgi:hypothetical protein